MKARVLLAALLVAASATTAMAAGPYVGASAGLSIFHDSDVSGFSEDIEYDLGGAVNVSVGYTMDVARAELEFGYRGADIEDSDAEATVMSYMLNGYYDFPTGTSFTPFIGAGIGLLDGELENGISVDDTVLGYQLTVGAAMKMAPNLNLDISYRYQGAADDFDFEGTDVSYGSSNILAGIRYSFY